MITNFAGKEKMKAPHLRKKVLDDDLCYYGWVALGSLDRIIRRFALEGILSPYSGNQFTRQALHIAAKRSPLFNAFLERRLNDYSLTPEPTRDEIREAEIEFEKRLPEFVERNKQDMKTIFPIMSQRVYGGK